jgi:hypothetical protein
VLAIGWRLLTIREVMISVVPPMPERQIAIALADTIVGSLRCYAGRSIAGSRARNLPRQVGIGGGVQEPESPRLGAGVVRGIERGGLPSNVAREVGEGGASAPISRGEEVVMQSVSTQMHKLQPAPSPLGWIPIARQKKHSPSYSA